MAVSISTTYAAQDNNVEWLDIFHNTRDITYRNPFGAVPLTTAITIKIRTRSLDLTSANVYVWNAHGGDLILPLTWQNNVDCPSIVGPDTSCDLWFATIPTSATQSPRILYYKFQLVDGSDSDWYVDDHAHNSYDHEDRYENGTGLMVDENNSAVLNNSFNITVYNASAYNNYLDSWAKNATIYQIMPDRFRNGDNTNDQWVYPDVYGNLATLHTTWHEAPEDARVTGGWSRDFFGGDLQGVMDELDYLQSLGVTAIYFNPIFNAPSNHGYDTTDYLNLNPRYGDNALFQAFAIEAEARGIKIILDGVFNHTGSDSRYFDRYNRWNSSGQSSLGNDGSGACESASSPFATFYQFLGAPFTGPCYDGRRYESWWGYDTLPNLIDWQANNSVRDYVFDVDNDGDNGIGNSLAVIQQWYSLGADGWRFDVADEIPHDFWTQFRNQVKNNDGLNGPLYSEVWFEATPWLYGDQMDATMNYRYRKAVLGFLVNSTWTDNDNNGDQTMHYLTPSQFDYVLNSIREDYPAPAWYAMMNLMGSHDTNRALFVIREQSNDLNQALLKMRMMAALQFTYPGSPTIYYGDEAGLGARDYGGYATWGAGKSASGIIQDDPYNRHPMVWSYDDYQFASSDGNLPAGLPNVGLQDYYRTLGLARRNYSVLRDGDLWTIAIHDTNQLYGYARFYASLGQCAIVLFNRDLNNTRNISNNGDLPLPPDCTGTFYDILPDNGVDNATGWTVSGSNITVNGVLPLTSVLLVQPIDNPQTTPVLNTFPIQNMSESSSVVEATTNSSIVLDFTITTLIGSPMVAGERVDFQILQGVGTLSANYALTDGSGVVQVQYNTPVNPESAIIVARIRDHSDVLYHAVQTVQVGLPGGVDVSAYDNLYARIGPASVGDLNTIGMVMTKFGNGETPMNVTQLSENPHPGPSVVSLRSPLVQGNLGLQDLPQMTGLEVVVQYVDGGSEGAYDLWWWNGSGWQTVANTIKDTNANTITAIFNQNTMPSINHFVNGAEFFVNAAPDVMLNTTQAQISANTNTQMSIVIDNSGLGELTNTGFTLNLPTGLVVATPPNVVNPCAGGTFAPTAGGSEISLSGGTISADTICTLSLDVTGVAGGSKILNTDLNAILDAQPIIVSSNTEIVYVSFQPLMTEQDLLYHLKMNSTPSGWNYIVTDFVAPDRLRIAVVVNGESGIVELTLNPAGTTTMMRWTVTAITNTTNGEPSTIYADAIRQHILTVFAHAINSYAWAIVGTANYDILDFTVLDGGLEVELVGLQ